MFNLSYQGMVGNPLASNCANLNLQWELDLEIKTETKKISKRNKIKMLDRVQEMRPR